MWSSLAHRQLFSLVMPFDPALLNQLLQQVLCVVALI